MKMMISLICCMIFAACNSLEKDPAIVLDEARSHVKNKEYAEALKDYVWFFENAERIKKSMAGVRLSYCINEWRKLGNIYEPALIKYREELTKRKERLINGEANWELFWEFKSLSKYDNKDNDVIDIFMSFHNGKNKKFAAKIFDPIKKDLAILGFFDICNEYTKNPILLADQIIDDYRMRLEMAKKRKDDLMIAHLENNFIDESRYLLTVLKKNNREKEYVQVRDKLAKESGNRDTLIY